MVDDISAKYGKIANLFLQCTLLPLPATNSGTPRHRGKIEGERAQLASQTPTSCEEKMVCRTRIVHQKNCDIRSKTKSGQRKGKLGKTCGNYFRNLRIFYVIFYCGCLFELLLDIFVQVLVKMLTKSPTNFL